MDGTASFQYLVDNVMTWKQSVDDLQTYIRQKYDDCADDSEQQLDQSQPKRRKSASMASIHSDDDDSNSANSKSAPRHAQRKRRPRGSLRSNASGNQKFRSRRTVVIFYDSHIQSQLDTLVKSYGVARNNLRKGKNAYVASHGFGLPALRRQHHNASMSSPRVGSKTGSQSGKPTTLVVTEAPSEPLKDITVFARADQQLQLVQDLCEKAAHQIIRDGDCKVELDRASQGLQTLFSIAESMLDALKKEEQRKDEISTEDIDIFSTLSAPIEAKTYRRPSLEAVTVLPKMQEPQVFRLPGTIASLVSTSTAMQGVPVVSQTIEVDEDEESGDDYIDLAISNYRSANMRRLAV